MPKRDFTYTERDYEGLKDELRTLAEKYFPSTFRDFSEYSIETMLMEMVAYTGDVVNFYLDDRFRQNFMQHANDIESVFRLAKSRGYRPRTVSVAYGELTLSQLARSTFDNSGDPIPDTDDMAVIKQGATFSDVSQKTNYTSVEACDFKEYDSYEIIETSNGVPSLYRVYKTIKVRSGERKIKSITVGETDPYPEFYLDDDVAYVVSIKDSDGENWYEVDYLAQDTIFEGVEIEKFSTEYEQYKQETPYILSTKRISKRFQVDHKSDGTCHLKFGSGVDIVDDTLRSLSSEDLLTTNEISKVIESSNFTINNFFNSDSFGIRPYNDTLTVEYIRSRGEEENANSGTIKNIININPSFSNEVTDEIRDSFSVNNEKPITGASYQNDIEKVKMQSNEAFYTQKRCVTKKDYIMRTMMLPNKFGNIFKVFVEEQQMNKNSRGVNIYTVSKDLDGNLTTTNRATKENLMRYLKEFKIASDRVNIIDPFIINIGVDFKFYSKKGFDNDEVLFNISREVEDYFKLENVDLNQPILIGDLIQKMDSAEGVISITDLEIKNLYSSEGDDEYSNVIYDTSINGENYSKEKSIVYPPLDVGIFELRYPLKDITGKHI